MRKLYIKHTLFTFFVTTQQGKSVSLPLNLCIIIFIFDTYQKQTRHSNFLLHLYFYKLETHLYFTWSMNTLNYTVKLNINMRYYHYFYTVHFMR